MAKEESTLSALKRLLIGATVLSVDTSKATEAGIARLTVQRGHVTTEFDICGNDLGDWIDCEKVTNHDVSGRALYVDMRQMLEHMTDHALYNVKDCSDYTFEALDDLKLRQFGFRCTTTHQEWWLTMKTVKNSQWSKHFSDPESRTALAVELSNGVIPGDFKFSKTAINLFFGDSE